MDDLLRVALEETSFLSPDNDNTEELLARVKSIILQSAICVLKQRNYVSMHHHKLCVVCYSMPWRGIVWHGIVWCGVAWHMVWHGKAWHGMVGMVWYGMVWYGMVWCGVVWCGVAWRGVA